MVNVDNSLTFTTVNLKTKTVPTMGWQALKNVSIMSQNTNSLSLSSADNNNFLLDKFSSKLMAILKNKPDICLLQDIRIGKEDEFVKKKLSLNMHGSYSIFSQSLSSNARGVAIIINNDLNFEVFNIYKSNCNNVIILDININGFHFSLGSIYGPLQRDCSSFIIDIKKKISEIANEHFILGGDYNAITNMTRPELVNPDLFQTLSIPNPIHSRNLCQWIEEGGAVDIYRLINPNKNDMSYIPFGETKVNRSRIDIFMVSPNLINAIHRVEYLGHKSTLFDHKLMCLKFKSPHKLNIKKIDSSLLELPNLYETIKFEVVGVILDHYELPNINFLRAQYTNISILNNQLFTLMDYINKNPWDAFISNIVENIKMDIANICNLFPPLDEMYAYPCNIDPDRAYEVVINAVKNSIISFQSRYKFFRAQEKKVLLNKLYALNGGVISELNQAQFVLLENKIKKLEEDENIALLKQSKQWDYLHLEKPSSAFANLIKRKQDNLNFDLITDDHDRTFSNEKELGDHLCRFFGNFFKKVDRPEGVTLRGFLGEDIINSDFVQDKILTEEEKNSLEGPFTMEELWEAMGNANLSSAPGVNGISNKVLVKFWELIKWPLRDGINFMMEKGELTGTMRLAKIRLIPKGGDNKPTKANKLRPITILTSDYKLGSGALSLRIRKVIEKITSRCQKAYSSKSFIHEGLITVYETMSKAIYQNKSLAVILFDFSRAFDSVQHKYLYEVLSFFNFGDGIINMIKTCLSNRAAAIINGSGLTESFPIDSGTPQGDLPSTDYFKIAVEPLLIKIICSLIIQMPMLNFNLKHDDKDPDEATAFADDMGGLIDTDPNILKELDKILKDFGILSGLNINSSKTKVIVVGPKSG